MMQVILKAFLTVKLCLQNSWYGESKITFLCEMYSKAKIVLQINGLPLMFLINGIFFGKGSEELKIKWFWETF